FPFVFTNSFYLNLAQEVALLGIAAIGMNLLLGLSGQISLGQAGFFAVGSYVSALLAQRAGLPLALTLPLATAASALAGLGLGLVALRARTHYLAMVTLAFGIIAGILAQRWLPVTGGSMGLTSLPQLNWGDVRNGPRNFFWTCAALLLAAQVASDYVMQARPGRVLRTIAESESFAATVGIRSSLWRAGVFVAAAALAGLSGALFAHQLGYVSSDTMNLDRSLALLIVVVVGGLGHAYGPLLGAVFLVAMSQTVADLYNWANYIFGALLLAVMVFMPHGLSGLLQWRRRVRALHGAREWRRAAAARCFQVVRRRESRGRRVVRCPIRHRARAYRTERRGQVDADQCGERTVRCRHRQHRAARGRRDGTAGAPARAPRAGAHVPEPPACRRPHRRRERDARDEAGPVACAFVLALALRPSARSRHARRVAAAARLGGPPGPFRRQPAAAFVRPSQAGGTGARAGAAADPAGAGRAGRRPQRGGIRTHCRGHPKIARCRGHDPAGGARHAVRDGARRCNHSARLRQGHCRRRAGGGAQRSEGDRGVPRHGSAGMLNVRELRVAIGANKVLHDVCLEVRKGQLVALVGANGAGKTTLLRALSGLLPLAGGEVRLDGQSVANWPAWRRSRAGLIHVPQGRQVVPQLTVRDNLLVGAQQLAHVDRSLHA